MATRKYLEHAPIREAIVDIRIAPAIDINSLHTLEKLLSNDFAVSSEMRRQVFGFEADDNNFKTSSIDHGLVGLRLTSKDEKYVLQVKIDGFTLSRLAPYEKWENMIEKAQSLWAKYIEAVKPEHVTRLATRYINVINLPLPISELKDYLVSPPEVPSKCSQELDGFFSRVVFFSKDFEARAIVNQVLEGTLNNMAPIIFDIDVFMELNDSISDDIWKKLENLREFKNQIFFESITNKTTGLFQ